MPRRPRRRRALIIPQWRLAHRLWSMRLLFFWAAVSGLWVALPGFAEVLPPIAFGLACVGMSVLIMLARISKQKGLTI